jgi:hypothetical protein
LTSEKEVVDFNNLFLPLKERRNTKKYQYRLLTLQKPKFAKLLKLLQTDNGQHRKQVRMIYGTAVNQDNEASTPPSKGHSQKVQKCCYCPDLCPSYPKYICKAILVPWLKWMMRKMSHMCLPWEKLSLVC